MVHPENLDDITACVIIKWLWQVVVAQAALSASVPHRASLEEFLWELMGRSGRGSRTSAVCGADRADNAQVWTGRAGVLTGTPDLWARDLMRIWGSGGVWKWVPSVQQQSKETPFISITFCFFYFKKNEINVPTASYWVFKPCLLIQT